MNRFALLLFALALIAGGGVQAQTPVLSNPSMCYDLGAINDNTCPSNSGFFQPNRFRIRVLEAPGTRLGEDVYLKEVRLIIQHTWAADLDISLRSPGGKTIVLTSDNGGGEDNYGNPLFRNCTEYAVFSVASCVPIEQGGAPFTNIPYQPEESLLVFNDGSSPIGDWELIICDDTEQDTGRLHFIELVFDQIQCLPVQTVRVLSQDTTAVALEWTPSAGCEGILTFLEYGPKGFTPGRAQAPGAQGTLLEIGCPPFVLTGLAPDAEYDLYIRKSCAPGDYSGNSCPVTIRTGCLPPEPTVMETFSEAALCPPICGELCSLTGIWRNAEEGNFDWLVYSGATPTQGTGPSAGVGGAGKYVYLEATGNQCTGSAVLRSGCFELNKQQTDACHVSFYYHMYGANIGSLSLEVSTDGIAWNRLWQLQGDQGDAWRKAYISLADYPDGSLLQFRFVAVKGNGPLGDIALANIAVHGSVYLGMPQHRFYADRDGDGYGDPNASMLSCSDTPPPGYVARAGDCNDQNPAINPGAPEVPCDGVDNNCNGLADDLILPPPTVVNDTICSGALASLSAEPVIGSFIFWYASPDGFEGLSASKIFVPTLPPNVGSVPQTYRFYAQAVDDQFRCFSAIRAEAVVVVNPLPRGALATAPAFCPGDSLDLGSLPIQDVNFTGATVTFHTGIPTTPGNALSATTILPSDRQQLAYRLTSPEGCVFSDTFSIRERLLPGLSFLPADSFSLCTGSSRVVQALAESGAGGYQFLWSTGETTSAKTVSGGMQAGVLQSLSVQVTDSAGCKVADSLVYLTTSSIDSLVREIIDVSACNQANGSILLRPLDGTPPFSYRWSGSNGVRGQSLNVPTVPFAISGLPQGAYRVTITDSSNERCAFVMPPAYVNGPGARIRDIRITPVRCAGAATGSVCVELLGNPQASFLWNTGATTSCISGVPGGMYAVTISENGCQTIVDSIFVPEAEPLRVVSNIAPASCSDRRDGSIALSAFGGSGGYRFQWNTGLLTASIGALLPGSYTATVTDVEGCTLTQVFQVPSPTPLSVRIDSLLDISCFGQQDGYVQVSGQGGTLPYRYVWENGSTSPARTGMVKGSYQVSVRDLNGCLATAQAAIQEPSLLTGGLSILELPKCVGDTSGVLQASGNGGVAPYTFLWNTGSTQPVLNYAGVGAYSVVARDSRGCVSDTARVSVETLSRLNWNATLQAPLCDGRSDGRISLNPSGRPPFRYAWSNGDTTAAANGLTPGAYLVQVVDAEGCHYDTSFVLRPRETPIDLVVTPISPSCTGGADGQITLEPFQVRYPPLFYAWENGSQEKDRKGLREGAYRVTVTDGQGCLLALDSLVLESPPPLEIELAGKGEIICQGDRTGFLEVAVSGGTGPYSYTWFGVNASTPSVYNLAAGAYRVFVQDSKGCPADARFTLSEAATLQLGVDVLVGNICEGDTTNQLRATIGGGLAPYALRWSNGRTDPVLNNVAPGDYSLVVRDAKGCQQLVSSIKVRDGGKPLELVNFRARDISCFGERDGRLDVSVSGGKAPYTYVFKGTATTVITNQTQWSLTGLGPSSSYGVVVSDVQGCVVATADSPIREPALLSVRRDSIRAVTCAGANTGAVFVTASGGTPPYAYNWFDVVTGREVATTEDLVSFRSGTYRLVVTDSRLCSDTLSSVTIPTRSSLSLDQAQILPVQCKGDSSGMVEVRLSGGRSPYRLTWNGRLGGPVLTNIPAGAYELVVVDADSCRTAFPPFLVTEPAEAIAAAETITPVSCGDRMDGAIQVQLSGTQGVFQSIWRNAQGGILALDTLRIQRLAPGTYRLNILDEKGCAKAFTYTVPQNPPIAIRLVDIPASASQDDGLIAAEVSGGAPPYALRWNTEDTTLTLMAVPPGLYMLTVTDTRNCTATDSITLLPTGLAEVTSQRMSGKLYPNPASRLVQLELDFPDKPSALTWTLFDGMGRARLGGALPPVQHIRQAISTESLPPGWYILSVRDSNQTVWNTLLMIQE